MKLDQYCPCDFETNIRLFMLPATLGVQRQNDINATTTPTIIINKVNVFIPCCLLFFFFFFFGGGGVGFGFVVVFKISQWLFLPFLGTMIGFHLEIMPINNSIS